MLRRLWPWLGLAPKSPWSEGSDDLPCTAIAQHPTSSIDPPSHPSSWHLPSPLIKGRHPSPIAFIMADFNNCDNESIASSEYGSHYTTGSTYTGSSASVLSRSAAASSVGRHTAPSFGQTPRYAGTEEYGGDSQFVLWCEFRDLKGCDATFRGDDEAAWIRHHAQHLKDRFPSELVCWFCDDHPHFIAGRTAERRSNFEDRMQHIREHIYSDYMRENAMRPDFYLLNHMYKHGQLNQEMYEYAMAYTEVPEVLRLPADDETPRTSQPGAVQYHDLAKEERHHRRKQKKVGKF